MAQSLFKSTREFNGGNIVLLLTSLFFERSAYYGIRSLIILFLLSARIGMSNMEAFGIFGTFTIVVYLTKLLGGLLGDLLNINQLLIIIGVGLQIVAALLFCIPNLIAVYSALGLLAIGSGLYSPNLTGTYAKHLLLKANWVDNGIAALYLIINCGATVGVIAISYLGEINFNYGFGIAALFSMFSLICILFSKNALPPKKAKNKYGLSNYQYQWLIAITIFISLIFWIIYEVYSSNIINFYGNFDLGDFDKIPFYQVITWSNFLLLFLGLGLFLAVVRKQVNSMLLMAIGMGCTLIIGIFLVSNIISYSSLSSNYLTIIGINGSLTIAELFVMVGSMGLIVKVANPKYLALYFGISGAAVALTGRLFQYIMDIIQNILHTNQTVKIIIACILAALMTALAITLIRVTGNAMKKNNQLIHEPEEDSDLDVII